ncbi:prepilin-type N-terminal cleavage/methylation domain-containing protein [Colwellia sp. BRX9-1]|jgi:MSHA pilin protein MshD|uniref:type IV pilus modification PilV family protein n=1 Tax=Colwellia sp. BRX9-1 TaxID=2759830 RepID=UPI0015F40E23|nr:prepilin-type N-terminal cleavage/methylation domain-containing protein [Colwellia sp. BRX9-1]MBA6352300.1 prepilin-type N-terminal cleavage/methylation domain-containing protein [Colwellia sp. BRX9-1]
MHSKPKETIKSVSSLQQGFTLVETIIGIVVLSISFSIFTTLIYPLANQSAEQVHQIRAVELGQSMINEILGKAFDEKSDMSGGFYRCGDDINNDGDIKEEDGENTCSNLLENEESDQRESYDDVDDYNGLIVIQNSLGESSEDIYIGYQLSVTVINDGDYDGISNGNLNTSNYTAKLITVTITTPQNFDFVFAAYKANF